MSVAPENYLQIRREYVLVPHIKKAAKLLTVMSKPMLLSYDELLTLRIQPFI